MEQLEYGEDPQYPVWPTFENEYYIGVDDLQGQEAIDWAVNLVRSWGDWTEIIDGPTIYPSEEPNKVTVYFKTKGWGGPWPPPPPPGEGGSV